MKNKDDMETKREITFSLSTPHWIIDTFCDGAQSYFLKKQKWDTEIQRLKEFEYQWVIYAPPSPSQWLINSWTVLLPSVLQDTWTNNILMMDLVKHINKYCHFEKQEFYYISVCYILMTYCYERFRDIPYLRFLWNYGSGKSRALDCIWYLCYLPVLTSGNISVAGLFRVIDMTGGTLVIDEADFWFSDTQSEMIKILNNGYKKWAAVLRADGDNYEPTAYKVFCPKLIAWRKEFTDKATESRCLTSLMQRSSRTDIPSSLWEMFEKESLDFRNRLMKWRYDYYFDTNPVDKKIPGIEPRLNQIIVPLLSIVNNSKLEEKIIAYLKYKQSWMRHSRRDTILGDILSIIITASARHHTVYFKYISHELLQSDGRYKVSERKIGAILKENLIYSERTSTGTYIDTQRYKQILQNLYIEHGLIEST